MDAHTVCAECEFDSCSIGPASFRYSNSAGKPTQPKQSPARSVSPNTEQEKVREATRIMRMKAEQERRKVQDELDRLAEDRVKAQREAANARRNAEAEAENIRRAAESIKRNAEMEARRLKEQAEAERLEALKAAEDAKSRAEREIKAAHEKAALSESLALGAVRAAQDAEEVRKKKFEAKMKELEASGISPNTSNPAEQATDCVICMDAIPVMAFVPCGHIATCAACAATCLSKGCPICRTKVVGSVKTYRT